jgi:hypothetical protein
LTVKRSTPARSAPSHSSESPELQEVRVALDFLHERLRELGICLASCLLEGPGERLERLLCFQRVDLLAAEESLAVGASFLQVAGQCRQAAEGEGERQLPALQRHHRCDQQRQRVLAVAVALVTHELRLVEQQHDSVPTLGEGELDRGEQVASRTRRPARRLPR